MTDARKQLSDVHNTGYFNTSGYYIIQTYTYSIKWQWQINFNQKKQLKCERHEPVWQFKSKKLNSETIILFLHPVFKTGDFIMQHARELKLKHATVCVVKLFIVHCSMFFSFWILDVDLLPVGVWHCDWTYIMIDESWFIWICKQ